MKEVEQAINHYLNFLARDILKEYKVSLGPSNISLITRMIQEDNFISLQEEKSIWIFTVKTDSKDLAIEEIKRKIPKKIFGLLINPNFINKNLEGREKEFVEDLTEGLQNIYIKSFCEKYHYVYELPIEKESTSIVYSLLAVNSEEINKDAMVFQTDFEYMMQMYHLLTGRNLKTLYENTYFTEKEIEKIKPFLKQYFTQDLDYYKIHNQKKKMRQELLDTISKNEFSLEEVNEAINQMSFCISEEEIQKRVKKKKSTNGYLEGGFILFFCTLMGILLSIFLLLR